MEITEKVFTELKQNKVKIVNVKVRFVHLLSDVPKCDTQLRPTTDYPVKLQKP